MLRRRDTKTPKVPARRNSYVQLSQSLPTTPMEPALYFPFSGQGKDQDQDR